MFTFTFSIIGCLALVYILFYLIWVRNRRFKMGFFRK